MISFKPLRPTATTSPAPCGSPDLTKWDKIFSMLENSQMRENMLLQYADDIIKVEIGSLRGEMLRLVKVTSSQIPRRHLKTSFHPTERLLTKLFQLYFSIPIIHFSLVSLVLGVIWNEF